MDSTKADQLQDLIDTDDARAWFTDCGYQAHGN
jgi:hypothetical protein